MKVNEILMYQTATISTEILKYELHLHPIGKLSDWMAEVIKVESPVHFDEAARRMVEAAGVAKIGSRIRDSLMQALNHLRSNKRIKVKGDFL